MAEVVIYCAGAPDPALQLLNELKRSYGEILFVGVDGGAEQLIKAGERLEFAFGDFDSVTPETYAMIRDQATHLMTFNSEKDDTDLELALMFMMREYPNSQHIILGGIGNQSYGRFDHAVANLWLVYQPRFQSIIQQLTFLEANRSICFLEPGAHVITPDRPQVKYLSLISLTPIVDWQISDAKYSLEKRSYTYPRALISNEFVEHRPVEVGFKQGIVMVIQEW